MHQVTTKESTKKIESTEQNKGTGCKIYLIFLQSKSTFLNRHSKDILLRLRHHLFRRSNVTYPRLHNQERMFYALYAGKISISAGFSIYVVTGKFAAISTGLACNGNVVSISCVGTPTELPGETAGPTSRTPRLSTSGDAVNSITALCSETGTGE